MEHAATTGGDNLVVAQSGGRRDGAIALFNKYPQGNTGFAYVASVLAVTMAYDRIASGEDPPDPNYTTVASVSPPNLDLTGVPPAAAQLVQTLEQTSES
jgi:hypothetical protein